MPLRLPQLKSKYKTVFLTYCTSLSLLSNTLPFLSNQTDHKRAAGRRDANTFLLSLKPPHRPALQHVLDRQWPHPSDAQDRKKEGPNFPHHRLFTWPENMETPRKSGALIVGVTGMIGLSLIEALNKPTVLGGPWKIYGTARRTRPDWFPVIQIDGYLEFDLLDFEATERQLSPVANQITHVFWNTSQVSGIEEENIIANSAMVSNVVKVLTSDPKSRLSHISLVTGTKQYMGPIFDSVLSIQLVPHESPFHEDMARLPYPNFYYVLEDLLESYTPKLTWSIHRSSIISGASVRSLHNPLLTFVAYALICRYEGSPFRYPGTRFTWEHFCDATDAMLLAEQEIWAAVTDAAKNHAFNCTNGDVFTWKKFWKVLCEIFDVEFVPFDETETFDWVGMMKEKGRIWDTIVEENGLYKTKLDEITCFGACHMVVNFNIQHVCSMTKSREFGFFGFVDTLKSVNKWVERFREMNIIPKNNQKEANES